MWRRRLAALLVATAAVTGLVSTTAPAVLADTGTAVEGAGNPLTFALIGDTPYGDIERAQFPALVAAVNADPQVRMVLHAGDVKNGKSTCDDAHRGADQPSRGQILDGGQASMLRLGFVTRTSSVKAVHD